MPTARTCLVSFTDSENIRHSVGVTASTLYEAAVLAIAEFQAMRIRGGCTTTGNAAYGDREDASHITRGAVGKIEVWLQGAGKPNEQAMKGRLRELLRM